MVANGVMLDKHDVLSGVPEGTVLASLFFIIMIANIDQHLDNTISRLFDNDTKVSGKINSQEDTEHLQHNLDKIYAWADKNLIVLWQPKQGGKCFQKKVSLLFCIDMDLY